MVLEVEHLVGVEEESSEYGLSSAFLGGNELVDFPRRKGFDQGNEFFVGADSVPNLHFQSSRNGDHYPLAIAANGEIRRDVFLAIGAFAPRFSAGVDHIDDTAGYYGFFFNNLGGPTALNPFGDGLGNDFGHGGLLSRYLIY
jgi:hypothetical protein